MSFNDFFFLYEIMRGLFYPSWFPLIHVEEEQELILYTLFLLFSPQFTIFLQTKNDDQKVLTSKFKGGASVLI